MDHFAFLFLLRYISGDGLVSSQAQTLLYIVSVIVFIFLNLN